MRSWYAIADMVGLFVLMIVMVTIFHRMDIYEQEYNAHRQEIAVEYSTEAAFDTALARNTAGLNYKNYQDVEIDTKDVLTTFEDMMCYNYNLSRTDTSRAAIEDTIRGGMLLAKDGYYVLSLQDNSYKYTKAQIEAMTDEEKNEKLGTKKLMWLPKQPYIGKIRDNKGSTIKTVSFNLSGNVCRFVETATGKYTKTDNGPLDTRLGTDFAKARRTAISQTVTNALARSVDNNDEVRGEAEFGSYIPSDQTISGINRIASPTIIMVMQGGTFTGQVAHENVAFTGIRTIKPARYIGYIKKGKKMYSRERQGAADDPACSHFNDMSSSEEQLARDGYVPDYEYIFNPINYDSNSDDDSDSQDDD